MTKINVGDTFRVKGSGSKVTVLKVDKKVILLLLHGSGEPFVVSNSFEIQNNEISWFGSRYRKNIDEAVATFNELAFRK